MIAIVKNGEVIAVYKSRALAVKDGFDLVNKTKGEAWLINTDLSVHELSEIQNYLSGSSVKPLTDKVRAVDNIIEQFRVNALILTNDTNPPKFAPHYESIVNRKD